MQPHPNLIHGGWEAFAAKTIHWLLYGSIVAMPVFGWLHHAALDGYAPIWWENVFPGDWDVLPFVPKSEPVASFFGMAHKITGIALIGALALHIGGALKHAVIDKDRTLARMVPGAYGEIGLAPTPKGYVASSLAAAILVAVLGIGVITAAWSYTRPTVAEVSDKASDDVVSQEADAWIIDTSASTLTVEIRQLGSPVTGSFVNWSADVVFDPDALDSARISAEVDTGSLTLSDVSDRATSDEFLNAEAFPEATFVSENVVATSDGYEAIGTLTLAGVSRPFTLPFTFVEQDGKATVAAQVSIPRLDYDVGTGFPDDSSVGRAVRLDISISASRARRLRSVPVAKPRLAQPSNSPNTFVEKHFYSDPDDRRTQQRLRHRAHRAVDQYRMDHRATNDHERQQRMKGAPKPWVHRQSAPEASKHGGHEHRPHGQHAPDRKRGRRGHQQGVDHVRGAGDP